MRTKKKVEKEPKKNLGRLKEAILEQVRLLSTGKISSAFNLVELGKELVAQESEESATEGDF